MPVLAVSDLDSQRYVRADPNTVLLLSVDNSGRWGRGGVFSALSARSPRPEQQYEMAHQMKDLHLGDVHLVAVDDLESRDTGQDFVRCLWKE